MERKARTKGLAGKARKSLRQAKSLPILADVRAYFEREQPAVLPKSPEGAAISCTLSNWGALARYCDDGDLEIDNNSAGRSLRGISVGRKNWTFLGSDEGGRKAAILTSIATTCKRLGVDPFEYLRDISQRISTHPQNSLDDLLPDKWKLAPPSQVC
jgi:transposase